MKFSLWTQNGALNSKPVFDAFRQGAASLGHTCTDNDLDSDIDVIWSVLWSGRMKENWTIWKRAQDRSKPIIVLEVGGIQRGTTWKVGLNGINRDAFFSNEGNTSARANQLSLTLSEWKQNDDGPIIICCQHDKSLQWANMPPLSTWITNTVSVIRQHTDRPIVVRPHPRCILPYFKFDYKDVLRQQPQKINGTYDNFDFKYSHAWAIINWSSNPAVEAVKNGIPVFVGPDSLAWPVANHSLANIENPETPDRTQWLNDLAYTEWTIPEIAQGIPLKKLTNMIG
jgi:hypothetical protein